MADTNTTTDHQEIKQWTEDRGGHPAAVKQTSGGGDGEVIRLLFDNSGSDNSGLKKIDWEEWFEQFDQNKLVLIHSTEEGNTFNKLVSRN